MRRGGGSQRSLPNIQARKPPFGIATRAPSWPKPTVIRSTAPVAVADLLTLLVDLPAAALFSRRGVLFRTIRVPIRWVQRSWSTRPHATAAALSLSGGARFFDSNY